PYDAFDQALFQTVSISTTAGFTTTGFADWPLFLPVLLLFSSFIGGCAGSTGGGMKVIRILLLTLQGARELKRLVHPRAVYTIKVGGSALPQRVVDAVWGFFSAYALVFVVCMLGLIATGMDELSAFSAVAATLNNLGPGLGEVALHFGDVNDKAKWVLIVSMLFGRL
ncbi:potassium transporter TrkG, partial [Vibrio sp. 2129(2023)]